jgi:DNA repair exonuclease SbcCD ATPase subunit
MLYFEKIKYKNILSAGNQFIEVTLNSHKTTILRGANGQGKSLLITALIFGLYGKSNRGVTKKQLVNSVNKKDCLVEISFTVSNKSYKIRRGISPNIFEIYVNDKLQDELSAVKDQQKYLEQNILKMSYKTFMQVVVLGSTNYVPFMELSSSERRDLVEELLDIKIFSAMNLVLKDKIRNLESDIREIDLQKKSIKDLIESEKEHIEIIRSSGSEMIERKQIELNSLSEETDNLIELNSKLQDTLLELNSDLEKLSYIPKKLKQFLGIYGKLQQKTSTIKEEVFFFENNTVCPTCTQTVDEDFRKNKFISLQKTLDELVQGEAQIYEDIKREEERENEFIKLSKEITNINSNLSNNQSKISIKNKQIKSIHKEIEEIKNKIETQDDGIKRLKKLISNLRKLEKMQSSYNESLEYLKFSHILMKDTGVKSKIIENYLPVMNTQINKYLQMMDLYINFQLDGEFKETINTPIHENYSYGSFSEGEKQRINLSLLLAWRDIARLKNSVNCNIMFFDETLDSSLDSTGIEDMLKIINYIVKDSNVLIISHRDGYDDKFERVLEVKKVNGFTKIQ